ncbi:hypothetical protein KI387_024329, partial [Taxus chinensis]
FHDGTLFEDNVDLIQATQSFQVREEEATPNPKDEKCIPAMEENHIVSEALNTDKAIEEPSVLPPTSSPLSYDVKEK